jgi:hypothetical protein
MRAEVSCPDAEGSRNAKPHNLRKGLGARHDTTRTRQRVEAGCQEKGPRGDES